MKGFLCDVSQVFAFYEEDLRSVDKELRALFNSQAFLLPAIGNYIVQSGGKRMRPLFLLTSAELCGYRDYRRVVLASIIEAIHTASLLHDDVVDNAEMRRGRPAAHSIWGNQVVILVGDFLYSNALRMAVMQQDQRIMDALSEATTKMTEGEILQLSKVGDPEVSVEEYYSIIAAKTGALISAACRIGAILAKSPPEQEEALAAFGMKTGMAFQMADDILDYRAEEMELGKRLGKDLEEGKLTLPMIKLLEVCTAEERSRVREIINNHAGPSSSDFILLRRLFEKYKIIERSFEVADALLREAKGHLDLFEDSEPKYQLLCLAEYALYRRY